MAAFYKKNPASIKKPGLKLPDSADTVFLGIYYTQTDPNRLWFADDYLTSVMVRVCTNSPALTR